MDNILEQTDLVWLCSISLPLLYTPVMQLECIQELEYHCFLQNI